MQFEVLDFSFVLLRSPATLERAANWFQFDLRTADGRQNADKNSGHPNRP
jgi:hypothetical protein